ncbi:MAG: peptidase M28, partial [Bdellovibrionota bacterium]
MRRIIFLPILLCSVSALSFFGASSPQESHLANVQQLTFGGKNAEGYFSPDGTKIIFQSNRPLKEGNPVRGCYQIYVMDIATREIDLLSTGAGGTTCSYLMNDGKHFIYSSTHEVSEECPTDPHGTERYQWAIHPFDIFQGTLDGKTVGRLTNNLGYDAEATVSPDGETIVFTSLRNDDLDLYLMNKSGENVRKLTSDYGYDGGAFFSPDGKKLVYRASHPKTRDEIDHYRELLSRNLVEPNEMQIFTINVDGSGKSQVTHNQG